MSWTLIKLLWGQYLNGSYVNVITGHHLIIKQNCKSAFLLCVPIMCPLELGKLNNSTFWRTRKTAAVLREYPPEWRATQIWTSHCFLCVTLPLVTAVYPFRMCGCHITKRYCYILFSCSVRSYFSLPFTSSGRMPVVDGMSIVRSRRMLRRHFTWNCSITRMHWSSLKTCSDSLRRADVLLQPPTSYSIQLLNHGICQNWKSLY